MTHPCLDCGACCAAFRVAFYWAEAQPENPDGVPAELAIITRPNMLAMRGTDGPDIRCIALQGVVGEQTHCTIYAQRPSPCRDLKASYENGAHSPQCDRAREKYNLPPLTPAIWSTLGVA
jgi:Fe-S-cluster containining protein